RYFDSRYSSASIVRTRALALLPGAPACVFRALGDSGIRRLIDVLKRFDAAVPADRSARLCVDQQRPDLVLVTPLVDFASSQVDYVKAARARGIPSGLCVASW